MRYILSLLSISVALLLCSCGHELTFKEENGVLSLHQQEQLIFSYQVETKSHQGTYPRANYIHPLNDFSDNPLTEDFPEDHLHQRGIFWSWHQVYIDTVSMADPWECRDIQWKVSEVEHWAVGKSGGFSANVDWLVGPQNLQVVQEKVAVVCQIFPEYYYLDFDISMISTQQALSIGGSDDNKGYGGFSARLMMGENVSFRDVDGQVEPDNEQVQAGHWIHMDDIGAGSAHVVLMYHPESSAKLQGWILRKKGSMQNPVWPGSERVVLNQGDQVDLRARVVVFKGSPIDEQIVDIYSDYIAE